MDESKSAMTEPGKWRQFTAAIIVNLSVFAYGLTLGWVSPSIPILQQVNNPIRIEPFSAEELSWMPSILCLVAFPVLTPASIIADKFGRKIVGCSLAVPFVLCWLLKIFATNYTALVLSRVFAGIGGGISFFITPLYVNEISADSIRGQLGSFMVFAINIGILTGYVLGANLSYQLFAICGILTPMVYFGCFIFMPETPTYLVRKNRIADATKSLMWLKSGDKPTVDRELAKLQALAKEKTSDDKSVGLRDLFRDRGTIRGLLISLVLLNGQQFSGITAMLSYTAMIFEMAGSSLAPNTSAIVIGVIQVFGSWLSTILMEKAGRKPLILISCLGMLLCHCTLGTFMYLQSQSYDVSSIKFIPLVALSVYAITYCLGMGPAPFIVSSEVFSPDIVGLATSLTMSVMFITAFAVVKFFPFFITLLHLHGCFFIFAIFCAGILVFTVFFIPETKGRSIESILDELNGCPQRFTEGGYVPASSGINEKNLQTSSV